MLGFYLKWPFNTMKASPRIFRVVVPNNVIITFSDNDTLWKRIAITPKIVKQVVSCDTSLKDIFNAFRHLGLIVDYPFAQ